MSYSSVTDSENECKEEEDKPCSSDALDTILREAGDFGTAQWTYLVMFAVLNVFCAWHYFAQTLISVTPPYTCKTEGPHPCFQWSRQQQQSYLSVQNLTSQPSVRVHVLDGIVANGNVTKCESGWKFDFTNTPETAVSEFLWICDSTWKGYAAQSAYFVGCTIGSLVLGIIADQIGRLPVLVLANAFAALGNIATAQMPTSLGLPCFALARLLAGVATDANFFMMYLLVMEFLKPELRSAGLNLVIGVSYTAGCVSVPWVARAAGHWRNFLLITSSPVLLILAFPLFLPESPRWIVASGRPSSQAVKSYRRIAALNGRKISNEAELKFKASIQSLASNVKKSWCSLGVFRLFKTPRLRKNTCILLFKSMVLTLCYDAISRHVSIHGIADPLTTFSIASIAVLPGCIVVALLQERLGRKLLAFTALILCGVTVASAGVARALASPHDLPAGVVASLAFAGRVSVTVAYNSGAQYAAELIPAEVQASGVAMVHVAGYAATVLAPQVLFLEEIFPCLTEIILGILSIIGAMLCLFLPETLNRLLPVTLEDAECFGDGESAWYFSVCDHQEENVFVEKYTVRNSP